MLNHTAYGFDDGDDCECDDDSVFGEVFMYATLFAGYGLWIAIKGDNPGEKFSFGRYPWAGEDSLNGDDSRPFNGDPEKRHWFFRPRFDLVQSVDEDLTGISAFFKIDSSYMPGFTFWYQNTSDLNYLMSETPTESVLIMTLESRLITADYVRIFWNMGASILGDNDHDLGAWYLGFGMELWLSRPWMFETRMAMHIRTDTVFDLYAGVNYQLHKEFFLTLGYRGLLDHEGKGVTDSSEHFLSLGVTYAFGK